jgi:decaprenylphospho-beta-D-erythro-pentofuranosid-2-ulose 2-reductase
MERIAVFGATSGIARAVAKKLMADGEDLILIGRSREPLADLARGLEKDFGRAVPLVVWDVLDFPGHEAHFRELVSAHELQGLFFAAGVMFPQAECDREPGKTRLTMDVNLTGPAVIIGLFAEYFAGRSRDMERERSGDRKPDAADGKKRAGPFISCVSSVAGERGRGKVLAYAAAKAGLSAYLAGLRHRLAGTGILVQTVKPGFVKTRMTEGLQSPIMATPDRVAGEIAAAIRCRREIVYTPFFWRYIMAIIKMIPAPIFRRMKF